MTVPNQGLEQELSEEERGRAFEYAEQERRDGDDFEHDGPAICAWCAKGCPVPVARQKKEEG